jgi:hypothetical protein
MFDGADLSAIAPGAAPFFALPLLDLPTYPQLTADFCSVPPPSDLAGPADFALLATGVIGIATGAYRRVGNLVKANKWADLCQFKAAPVIVPRAGYCIPPGDGRYIFNLGTVPALAQSVTITVYGVSGRGGTAIGSPGVRIFQSNASQPSQPYDFSTQYGSVAIDQDTSDFPHVFNWPMGHGNWTFAQTFYLEGPWPIVAEQCVDAELRYVPAGAAPTDLPPPDPVDVPDDYPTTGPCDSPSLSDLCKAIAALDTRLRWVADQLVPPELTPGDEAEVPAADPDTGGTLPIDKPPDAVGVIITATVIPPHVARYGTAPKFYPALGHVAMLTLAGPLPSVLIKHSPMVLTPLPAQVKQIQVDMNEGCAASFTWL